MPTLKECLLEQFECAIAATFGDLADAEIHFSEEDISEEEAHDPSTIAALAAYIVSASDIDEIARKVKWYLGK